MVFSNFQEVQKCEIEPKWVEEASYQINTLTSIF